MTKREVRSCFGGLFVGAFLGVLMVFVSLYSLGAFRVADLVLIPVATVKPEKTPTPAPTPTPDPEAVEEKLWMERWRFDNRDRIEYYSNGPDVIDTSKKGGVVEHQLPLLPIGGNLGTAFTHRCCDCALTHLVQITATADTFGLPALALRWTRLERETEQARRLKWGLRWRAGGPFPDIGGSITDPWKER